MQLDHDGASDDKSNENEQEAAEDEPAVSKH